METVRAAVANTPFHFADFDRVWPKVAQRAQRVIPSADIESARQAEHEGTAACLMCDEGLLMLTVSADERGTIAYVILAVSTGLPGAFKRHEGDMLHLAKDIGAQRIAFRTERVRAWARLLGPQWTRTDDRFEREVC